MTEPEVRKLAKELGLDDDTADDILNMMRESKIDDDESNEE